MEMYGLSSVLIVKIPALITSDHFTKIPIEVVNTHKKQSRLWSVPVLLCERFLKLFLIQF